VAKKQAETPVSCWSGSENYFFVIRRITLWYMYDVFP
jgi:hypothetical protein